MIVDSLETGAAALPEFKEAIAFLKKLDANTPVGRIDISDRMYCNVMEYDVAVPWGPCKLEAHKAYIDIQVVLSGAEDVACHNVAGLEVETPYSAKDDVLFYRGKLDGMTRIALVPGMFAVLYPNDGHNGRFIPASGANHIRKAVLKFKID